MAGDPAPMSLSFLFGISPGDLAIFNGGTRASGRVILPKTPLPTSPPEFAEFAD
jgi:hypothetical protein